jgi:Tol biopolymer transport system component
MGPDHEDRIIYNDLIEGKYSSVICSINGRDRQVLPMPIYTISSDGRFALCIDQERHHFCRPSYSYAGISNPAKDLPIVPGDGIWFLDLNSGKKKQIVSVEQLLKISPISNMESGVHYVEHLMLNPSSNRFCFLHRWKLSGGGIYARLYTADVDGENIYLLNDSGRMSHYSWKNDDEILAYGGLPTRANQLRKHKQLAKFLFRPLLPIYHKLVKSHGKVSKIFTGDGYILFRDKTQMKKRVASDISGEDGHPSFLPGQEEVFVTDTYPKPENGSKAQLILYSLLQDKAYVVANLNSIAEFDNTGCRCDLHPKCSYDGKYVSIDTMDGGERAVYLYEIGEKIEDLA